MEVLWENGEWRITNEGLELRNKELRISSNGLEVEEPVSGTSGYCIEANRLREQDWFTHLMGKDWFDPITFASAYYMACSILLKEDIKRECLAEIPHPRSYELSLPTPQWSTTPLVMSEIADLLLEELELEELGDVRDSKPKIRIWVDKRDAVSYQLDLV